MLTNLFNNLKINSMTEFNSKIKQNSRILKIFLFSICALFACAINSHAQSLVKGTVTDGTGEPLPGVSIVVKGTTNGTVTDMDGKYSIQAAAKDILSFSGTNTVSTTLYLSLLFIVLFLLRPHISKYC